MTLTQSIATEEIELSAEASVLLINTERATDPALNERLPGASPDRIASTEPVAGVA